jgi:predicted ABC-type ATPase
MVKVRRYKKRSGVQVKQHKRNAPESTKKGFSAKDYPLQSTESELNEAVNKGNRHIKRELSKKEFRQLLQMKQEIKEGKDSLNEHTKNGKLSPARKKLHEEILRRKFKDKSTIDKKDPDFYFMGGVAGSGKTSVLANKYIPEKTLVIDSDSFKEELSKKTKSPLKRHKLAHAGKLHEEADLLVEESIAKARREKRDIALDATMANRVKAKKLLNKFESEGYDSHALGTQVYPHKSIERAAKRFTNIKGQARYVPLELIRAKGNTINKNVIDLKNEFDTHRIVDNSGRPPKLVFKKGNLKQNFRNP